MISPRLEAAVSGERALAVASLEVGSVRRAATIAMTRSRQRLPSGPRMRSSPIWRSVPRTAATWPWGSAANGEHLRGGWGRNDGSALEQGLEGFKETGGPVGEVAQRAFLDLSTLAIGLAQEDGGRRAAVGDHLDEHAHPECHEPPPLTRTRTRFTCLQLGAGRPEFVQSHSLAPITSKKFGLGSRKRTGHNAEAPSSCGNRRQIYIR